MWNEIIHNVLDRGPRSRSSSGIACVTTVRSVSIHQIGYPKTINRSGPLVYKIPYHDSKVKPLEIQFTLTTESYQSETRWALSIIIMIALSTDVVPVSISTVRWWWYFIQKCLQCTDMKNMSTIDQNCQLWRRALLRVATCSNIGHIGRRPQG